MRNKNSYPKTAGAPCQYPPGTLKFRIAQATVEYVERIERKGFYIQPSFIEHQLKNVGRRQWLVIRAILGAAKNTDIRRYLATDFKVREAFLEWKEFFNSCSRYYKAYSDFHQNSARIGSWKELKDSARAINYKGQLKFNFCSIGPMGGARNLFEGEKGAARDEIQGLFKNEKNEKRNLQAENETIKALQDFF